MRTEPSNELIMQRLNAIDSKLIDISIKSDQSQTNTTNHRKRDSNKSSWNRAVDAVDV